MKTDNRVRSPSYILREHYMPMRGLTVETLAAKLNMNSKLFEKYILSGKQPFTRPFCEKLAPVVGTSVGFWIRKQREVNQFDPKCGMLLLT